MTIEVEQVSAARVAVADVRHPSTSRRRRKWQEQDAGQRKVAAQPRGKLGVEAVRHSAPRPSAMARSTAGPACSPRQATTASPAVVKAARPTVAQPPGESMSPWTNASEVQTSSQ